MLAAAWRLRGDSLGQIAAVLQAFEGGDAVDPLVRIDVEIDGEETGFGAGAHADHRVRPFFPPLFYDRTINRCVVQAVLCEWPFVLWIAGEHVPAALGTKKRLGAEVIAHATSSRIGKPRLWGSQRASSSASECEPCSQPCPRANTIQPSPSRSSQTKIAAVLRGGKRMTEAIGDAPVRKNRAP
jgi:hypothetical protein